MTPLRKPLRVALVGPLVYEFDNRTMRYARSLHERGDQVQVLAVGRPGDPPRALVEGIELFRLQNRRRNERGPLSFLLKLGLFLLRSSWFLLRQHRISPYDLIHVHSVPDFEVFAAIAPKLRGAKVLLDIYDVSPEFYLSKFRQSPGCLGYQALRQVERVSCRFADHVIAANHLWRDLLIGRSVPAAKCSVFINYIDLDLFHPRARTRQDGRFILLYPGVLNWHQGLDIALRAFAKVKPRAPQAEFHIYGEGTQKESLRALARQLGVSGSVRLMDMAPLGEMPAIMANADVGLVAKRADVFGNEAYSTKILEYMSQRLPVVLPRTRIDSFYFNEEVALFYQPENPTDMAEKILALAEDRALGRRLADAAWTCVRHNSWQAKQHLYLRLVDQLIGRPGAGAVEPVVY